MDIYGNVRQMNFTVNVVSLTLTSSFDPSVPIDGTSFDFPYTPTGDVDKTFHYELDGEEIETEVVSRSGREMRHTISGLTHGRHVLRVYFDAVINGA